MKKHVQLVSFLAVAASAAAVGATGSASASAANGPTYCGALNMLADPTMGTVPMQHDTQTPNGNDGMFLAVAKSCS